MKLRKALDKAKKERSKNTPSLTNLDVAEEKKGKRQFDPLFTKAARSARMVARNKKVKSTLSSPEPGDLDKKGAHDAVWQPPVYSESASIDLDPDGMCENRCVDFASDGPELDSYKVLRTQIQQLTQQKGWKTVMITSPQPGEGKTLTSINLALTFSKAYNQTILLVDCDLRQQNVHKRFGFNSPCGLIDYLVDDKPLKEVIIWPKIDQLTLISGGRTIQNSAELLGSPRMKDLVEEMKARYDDRYVLFDAPPVLLGADTLALAPYVDCLVMVVEEGRTSMRAVQKALKLISKEKFLGFVINRQKRIPGN
jgi:non-specific protein-tyrosine kinase